MAYTQESAQLFMAIQNNPHQVMVYKDINGLLHLAFYTPMNGWFAPCGIGISAAPMSNISYGKPTCFGCLLDDEDPADVGRANRNIIKLYSERKGQHVRVRVFMGHPQQTLVWMGELTMLDFEWRELRAAIVLGAKPLGMRVLLEEQE